MNPPPYRYSGLNLNLDKATKPQTVQIVRQGEATPYWFKVNPLYKREERYQPRGFNAFKHIPSPSNPSIFSPNLRTKKMHTSN